MKPRLPLRLWPHCFTLAATLCFFHAFHFGASWGLREAAGVALFQAAAAALGDWRLRRDLRSRFAPGPAWVLPVVFGALLAGVLVVWAAQRFSWSQLWTAGIAAALGRLLGRPFTAIHRLQPRPTHEFDRWLLLLAASLFLVSPYGSTRFVGAGDAEHYARQLADFLAQSKAGVFPVFAGQSLAAFGGDIHPLRTAPYFQHLGGLAHVLTGFSLNAIALLNLLIVLSFVAAVFICYWTLSEAVRFRPWALVWLALLFGSSPGVLALIYSGDMVLSWMALPWLPLLFAGWLRTWREADPARGLVRQAAALAMIWLASAPIAAWAAFLTAGNEGVRLVVRGGSWRSGLVTAGAAVLSLLLCQYVFVSVATLNAPENPYLSYASQRGLVMSMLNDSWAGPFRLVSAGGDRLATDLHLSPGLWLAALIGVAAIRTARWPAGVMAAVLALLTLLLIPWRGVTDLFWNQMPAFVLTITEKWPEQRFYPLLSAMIPFLAAAGLAGIRPVAGKAGGALTLVLALGVGWSAMEAMKFRRHGHRVTRSDAATAHLLRPENNRLSGYSYEMWGRLPREFSFAHMNPMEQVRLLDDAGNDVLDSNTLALLRAHETRAAARRMRYLPTDTGGAFAPPIILQPGQTRALIFDFKEREPAGTLRLAGLRLQREYHLPSAGKERAFGAQAGNGRVLLVHNEGTVVEEANLTYIRPGGATSAAAPAGVEILDVNPDELPFRVRSLIPCVLEVDLRKRGLLETPKLLVPHYRITVDGQIQAVQRTPDNLAAVPVSAGRHVVRVSYDPPAILAASFWLNLGALAAALALCLWPRPRHARRRPTAGTLACLGKWGLVGGLGAAAVFAAVRLTLPPGREELPPGVIRLITVFPVGRHGVYETLVAVGDNEGDTTSVVAFYADDRQIRIGCRKNGVLKILTDAGRLPISYFVPHTVEVFAGPLLTPADRRRFADLDDAAWDALRHTMRVRLNGHLAWETDLRHHRGTEFRFAAGRDPFAPQQAGEEFRGKIIARRGFPSAGGGR